MVEVAWKSDKQAGQLFLLMPKRMDYFGWTGFFLSIAQYKLIGEQ